MTLSFVPHKIFNNLLKEEIQPEVKSELLSYLCRINILYMINNAGSGHIGTSFSSIDLMSWVFLKYVLDNSASKNYFFSSKGHDAPAMYSVMSSLGLIDFNLIHKLRKIDGLPGHPDVNTPNVITNTGSLGMGISKAKGIIKANRLKKRKCRVFVMTGDGELQEGQFWESLMRVKQEHLHELIIIIDNNKFQSDRTVEYTSNLGELKKKITSFGIQTVNINGHNVFEFSKHINELILSNQPSAIIANTIKGNGVSLLEANNLKPGEFYKFHSGAIPDETFTKSINELSSKINQIISNNSIYLDFELENSYKPESAISNSVKKESLIEEYSISLLNQARKNKSIIALDGDLILDTGLIPFEKEFPDRFFECGIAEQDMVSQAGTLALEGFLPIVHSFASFLSSRPNEQIYNNATENSKIIYVGSLAGILPGGPGHSHQSVRDIASLSGIPNLELVQPSCSEEVSMILNYCINDLKESSYIRLCSIPIETHFSLPKKYKIEKGKGTTIAEGKDIIIFSYGPVMINELLKTRSELMKIGIKIKIINLPWLNYVDSEWLKEQIKGFEFIFTLDDHYESGGQGEMLLSNISQQNDKSNFPKTYFKIGINEVPKCGSNEEVLSYHKIDSLSILKTIKETISKNSTYLENK
ncbi:MAG: transketolase [Chloroflexi bacterium]|nr:transketolase [Chloroflexota bacterium]|tara:strand:- start:19169 stop:21100 length:1932 start_codon:yes stop_codon:yes gene_type:complete